MENKRLLVLYAVAALAIYTTATTAEVVHKVTFSERTLTTLQNLSSKQLLMTSVLGGAIVASCAMGVTKYKLANQKEDLINKEIANPNNTHTRQCLNQRYEDMAWSKVKDAGWAWFPTGISLTFSIITIPTLLAYIIGSKTT